MRRTLIQAVLPLCFCAVPLLAAVLVAAALPSAARSYYIQHLTTFDLFILGLGALLFLVQTLFAWRALRWLGADFDPRPDSWLTQLGQAAEWFPLLGLLGTVAAILQTFGSITGPTAPEKIISLYAPAITATGSGLFMALVNILPTWVVQVGRNLIRTLGGAEPVAGAETETGVADYAGRR